MDVRHPERRWTARDRRREYIHKSTFLDPGLDVLPIGKNETPPWRGSRILAFGSLPAAALEVVNMRLVRLLDEVLMRERARSHTAFACVEDNAVAGGATARSPNG